MVLLRHSAAELLRKLLVDEGLGATDGISAWSVFVNGAPAVPNSCITIYDESGRLLGRQLRDGEFIERFGIQILVRSATYQRGFRKIASIAKYLDTGLYAKEVSIGDDRYYLHSFSRTSGPIHVGIEAPDRNRRIFSLNGTLLAIQLT